MKKAYNGFTLAEVLIALVIIGVIAAITVPTIIASAHKQATITGLKKVYSVLSNAVNKSVIDNPYVVDWDDDTKTFIQKYIAPYVSHTQKLSTLYRMGTLSTQGKMNYNIYLDASWNANSSPIYVLQDGMFITYANSNDGTRTIVVDINGQKGPNMMGIDGFAFSIDEETQQLYPSGWKYDRDTLIGKKGSIVRACKFDNTWQYYRGGYCAALIMKDGWQIKGDYPWGRKRKTS